MTENRGMKMVEPSGIEPLTSTMPLSRARDFPPFLQEHLENAPRTGGELKRFSVPVGPKERATNLLQQTAALTKNEVDFRHG